MAKKPFTEEEMIRLRSNKYVLKVSPANGALRRPVLRSKTATVRSLTAGQRSGGQVALPLILFCPHNVIMPIYW